MPLKKTQWGLGKPFICEGCGTRLAIPKNQWIGIVAILAFILMRGHMNSTIEILALGVGLGAVVLLLMRFFSVPKEV